jgi:hypothetical protein
MNRREFLLGWLLLPLRKVITFGKSKRYGLVSAGTHFNVKTVLFNGSDVTHYCCAANDTEHWVDILPIDRNGRIISQKPIRKTGDVVIIM